MQLDGVAVLQKMQKATAAITDNKMSIAKPMQMNHFMFFSWEVGKKNHWQKCPAHYVPIRIIKIE